MVGGKGVCSNDVGEGDFGEELVNNVGGVSLKGWRECSGIIEKGGASSENI